MSDHSEGVVPRRRVRSARRARPWSRHLPAPLRRWLDDEIAPLARVLASGPVLIALALGYLSLLLASQFPETRFIDVGGDRNSVRDRGDVGRDNDYLYLTLDGYYDPERLGEIEFRWTTDIGRLTIPVVAGNTTWTGTLRLATARPPDMPSPPVEVFVDGRLVARFETVRDFADYTFTYRREPLPPSDMAIVLRTTTFEPSGDPRPLGVMLDNLTLTPTGPARPFLPPPQHALTVLGLLVLAGGMLGRLGLGPRAVAATLACAIAALLVGLVYRHDLTARYLPSLLLVAFTLVVALLALWPIVRRLYAAGGVALAPREERLLFGVFLFGAAVHLAGVFFPSFWAHDMGFQVNRLKEVLEGDLLLSAVSAEWGYRRTPYPPALYILVAPFAGIAGDPALALRLLPPLIDATSVFFIFYLLRRVGLPDPAPLLAALCYTLIPATFQLLWWGFFPNLFGQWATLVVLTLTVAHRTTLHRPGLFAALVGALSLALLSHPGTFVLTIGVIVVLAAALALTDAASRRGAALLLVALGLSLAIAYALYYRHFAGLLFDQVRALVSDVAAGRSATPTERGWEDDYIRRRVLAFPFLLYFAAAWFAGVRLARARNILGWALLAILATATAFAALHVAIGVWVRYFVFLAPALAIGMGLALAWLLRYGRWGRAAAYAGLAYCVVATGLFWFSITIVGERSPYP